MKGKLRQSLLILCFGYCSMIPLKAQFWELLLEPFFVEGFYYIVFAGPNEPTWQETTFAAFPYDLPEAGLFLPTTLEGDKSRFHAVAHFQNNERKTTGGFVQVKYAPISLLTAEVSYLQLFDQTTEPTNNIGFTTFNLSYNRFRHHRIHFWWGLGGIFLNESNETTEDDKTFAFNLGLQYYFKKPMSLYLETQMGNINSAFGALSQARIQVHLDRYLIYAGYQDVNFGDFDYGSLSIGGGVYF